MIGGNLGDRKENLQQAIILIRKSCGPLIKISSLYETAAWGLVDQPSFLNQALEISTSLSAIELLSSILSIEKDMGRTRTEKLGPRLIDIDILFFNDEVHDLPHLKIPHPEIQKRNRTFPYR